MGNKNLRFRLGTALASVLAVSASSAGAATLRIEFNGLDFKYDAAGNLYDASAIGGGTGNGACLIASIVSTDSISLSEPKPNVFNSRLAEA